MSLNVHQSKYDTLPKDKKQFVGRQFAVGVSSFDNGRVLVTLYSEDDETWYIKTSFSSYWLQDMIDQLSEAKRYLTKECKIDNQGLQRWRKP